MAHSEVLGFMISAATDHIVYYQQNKRFAEYIHHLNSDCGTLSDKSLYSKESNAAKVLHFIQQSKQTDFHCIDLPHSHFKIWCLKEQNLDIAIILNKLYQQEGDTMDIQHLLHQIQSQFISILFDTNDIPLYIIRIRCKSMITPMLRKFKNIHCKSSLSHCCSMFKKCLLFVLWTLLILLFLIVTCVIPGLCILYRYWRRERATSAALSAVARDLDAAVEEAEVGFGMDIDTNQIGFNPLATGFCPSGPTQMEFIRPSVERPLFRMEFGPAFSFRDASIDGSMGSFRAAPTFGASIGSLGDTSTLDSVALKEQDADLDDILQGVKRINAIAQDINMEIEVQSELLDEVQAEIDKTKEEVHRGIEMAIDRGDALEDLDDKAGNLSDEAMIFRKRAKSVRRYWLIQNWKCLMKYMCCGVCVGVYYSICCIKNVCIHWRNSRKVIDNVFADLENMFYLLSQLLNGFRLSLDGNRNILIDIMMNILKMILLVAIIYPLIIVICVVTILPSLFFLLIVRMNKIETDTKKLNIRKDKLESETKCERFLRLIQQFIRSSFIFSFIGIYPMIITYIIIPRYGYVLLCIGSYLWMILLLQIFGTYRGLKSFSEKNKKMKNISQKYKPQQFKWNIGSLIAIILLIYEIFQFTMFAAHIIDDNSNHNDSPSSNDDTLQSTNQIMSFLIKISYISFEFVSDHFMEFYSFFNIICVGLLILFFVFRFIFELKKYGKLKYIQNKINEAQEFYFHSFIGTIIYGHGTLKNLSKFTCKIVSLLSDTLFLIICEKLILILCCDSKNKLIIDGNVVCWEGDHQFYATINLILIGYYIPICVMIAPMFAENDDDEDKDKNRSFFSFSSTVSFVKPFLSVITVTKCFMLITSTFMFSGDALGTIISQTVSMILLLLFTLIWCFKDLKLYGLTQNKPGFPYAVNLIRVAGFGCGVIGCGVEILRYYTDIIDTQTDFIILLSIMALICSVMFIIFKVYHSKYEQLDDDILQIDWIIKYEKSNQKIKVIAFEPNHDLNGERETKEAI